MPSRSFLAAVSAAAACAVADAQFVTRQGSSLYLGGSLFRWVGGNIYWLGLDENVGGVAYPTKFRIEDALATAAGLNLTVLRSHTLGISTGNPLSFEPSLDLFNHSALDAADYAIHVAETLGLKLQVPLTDPYKYYHGGLHNFVSWVTGQDTDETPFYTNASVIAAFERYLTARLTHVNPYTGRPAYAEPAIFAWETGNELSGVPPAWTERIAAFIKSLDPNHLVMDGRYGVDPLSLPSEHVDLYSDHFYPVDAGRMRSGAAITAAANKAYVAGEYGWTSGDVSGFLDAAVADTNVSGAMFWSLFPHLDTYGFVQHSDGFTFHYPGDNAGMAGFLSILRQHVASINGRPSPAPLPAPLTPLLAPGSYFSANNSLAWRGAALGATYTVEVSKGGPTGPWTRVCDACANDDETPWKLPSSVTLGAGVWVHARAENGDGLAGNWSDPWQCC
jgi:hypothetical protein